MLAFAGDFYSGRCSTRVTHTVRNVSQFLVSRENPGDDADPDPERRATKREIGHAALEIVTFLPTLPEKVRLYFLCG